MRFSGRIWGFDLCPGRRCRRGGFPRPSPRWPRAAQARLHSPFPKMAPAPLGPGRRVGVARGQSGRRLAARTGGGAGPAGPCARRPGGRRRDVRLRTGGRASGRLQRRLGGRASGTRGGRAGRAGAWTRAGGHPAVRTRHEEAAGARGAGRRLPPGALAAAACGARGACGAARRLTPRRGHAEGAGQVRPVGAGTGGEGPDAQPDTPRCRARPPARPARTVGGGVRRSPMTAPARVNGFIALARRDEARLFFFFKILIS